MGRNPTVYLPEELDVSVPHTLAQDSRSRARLSRVLPKLVGGAATVISAGMVAPRRLTVPVMAPYRTSAT